MRAPHLGDCTARLLLEDHGKDEKTMKKIIAAVAGLLIASPAVHAGETWVMAARNMWGTPKSGTPAAKRGWHGLAVYIDLQSVVKKGGLVFYYEGYMPLDKNKRIIKKRGWDESQQKPTKKYLRIANCKTFDLKQTETSDFRQPKPAYRPVIKLACE